METLTRCSSFFSAAAVASCWALRARTEARSERSSAWRERSVAPLGLGVPAVAALCGGAWCTVAVRDFLPGPDLRPAAAALVELELTEERVIQSGPVEGPWQGGEGILVGRPVNPLPKFYAAFVPKFLSRPESRRQHR